MWEKTQTTAVDFFLEMCDATATHNILAFTCVIFCKKKQKQSGSFGFVPISLDLLFETWVKERQKMILHISKREYI